MSRHDQQPPWEWHGANQDIAAQRVEASTAATKGGSSLVSASFRGRPFEVCLFKSTKGKPQLDLFRRPTSYVKDAGLLSFVLLLVNDDVVELDLGCGCEF